MKEIARITSTGAEPLLLEGVGGQWGGAVVRCVLSCAGSGLMMRSSE